MTKSTLYLLLVLVTTGSIGYGQQKPPSAKPGKDYTIPFTLTEYNNLSVQAILNEKDTVQLMFHTAANAVTLTEESIQKLKTLQFDKNTDSVKSWGGQANSSRLSSKNSLQIGGFTWTDVPIWENKNSGQHTDGKFGIDLFTNKVIEIDFDKNTIGIYNKLPKKARRYQKTNLLFENDEMFIQAMCTIGDTAIANKFLIHSGYAGAILFDDLFVKDNLLGQKLPLVGVKELKDSFGNTVKVEKAMLPLLKIGIEQLTNVPAGFFEGAIGRQKLSIIGGDVLKRFNLIFDAQRTFVYLKANKLYASAYSKI